MGAAGGVGRAALPQAGRMPRIHLLQHGFNLADTACEEALCDSAALRAFADIDLGCEPVPEDGHVSADRCHRQGNVQGA